MIPLVKNSKVSSPPLVRVPITTRPEAYFDRDFLEIESVSINYHQVYYDKPVWKTSIDLLFGTVGMLIVMLLFPFIALGIKCSSSGPVIFKQERTGYDGNVFICYKFRTMHIPEKQPVNHELDITQDNDARIFKFGKFLRKTNLDEIPQFINVIKGDMSIVGPRPYPVRENSHWNSTFPDFYKRFAVKPGLTGLAQATGFRGGTMNLLHMRERLRRDLVYIEERSLAMDLRIIFLTIRGMLTFNTKAH